MTVRNEPAVLLINGAAKNLEDAVRNRSPTAGQKASRGDTNGDNGAAKKFEGRGEKSQSNSEAAGGPRTPESRRLEQGYCAPAGMNEGTVKVHVRQIMRKFG